MRACVARRDGRCFVRACFMNADWRRGSRRPRQTFSRTVDMHEKGVYFPGVFGNDRQTGERLLPFLVVFPGFVRGEPVPRRERPLFGLFSGFVSGEYPRTMHHNVVLWSIFRVSIRLGAFRERSSRTPKGSNSSILVVFQGFPSDWVHFRRSLIAPQRGHMPVFWSFSGSFPCANVCLSPKIAVFPETPSLVSIGTGPLERQLSTQTANRFLFLPLLTCFTPEMSISVPSRMKSGNTGTSPWPIDLSRSRKAVWWKMQTRLSKQRTAYRL